MKIITEDSNLGSEMTTITHQHQDQFRHSTVPKKRFGKPVGTSFLHIH